MEQVGSHWTDFHGILYSSIFRKSVEKIQVPLKSGKNNEYFTWCPVYICDNIAEFFLKGEMFQTKAVKKKHILCSVTFFPKIVPFMG
jgi:hypothetical protein